MSQVTQRTENSIITAMISLLQKKPFEKITVGDICDEALINHSTFYRYFSDKYSLLHAVFSYLLDDLLNNTSNAKTIVYQIADFMEKNSSFIHHISPQYQTRANLYPEFRMTNLSNLLRTSLLNGPNNYVILVIKHISHLGNLDGFFHGLLSSVGTTINRVYTCNIVFY
ncbi:TetR family transcriptional regulator [Companilactobacillus mindensis DSM 14500]|uniref:TetR family transcriptional regulator n=1 Tax=Companilactobacillus mindensis DSM 14500 TaxID=1423770 RepID=A0A0R1QI35_9LACO|nr:TetR/AcrR family transcriptional regulator [Companilactobacillus mindensis]KRL44158.1 TetR family transcriptional regulator [Companilactobacillus mindensis DSM 14500]GEO79491.1 hypothetical protein LMI01_18220 [Companilactobacillus mindensis]